MLAGLCVFIDNPHKGHSLLERMYHNRCCKSYNAKRRLFDKSILDQGPDRFQAVVPVNLLTLGERAGLIADRHLCDDMMRPHELGCDFRTKLEPLGLQV